MDLVDEIYAAVLAFPKYELFALAARMRKAAASIPSNIAEGQGRFSFRDFRHFLREARASAYELETEISIAARQRYYSPETEARLIRQTTRVVQLINGLIRNLSKRLIDTQRKTRNEKRGTSTAANPRLSS